MKTYPYELFTKIVFMQSIASLIVSVALFFYFSEGVKSGMRRRKWKTSKNKLPRAAKRN